MKRWRLFLILWLAGIAGVLSFLLVDLSALIAALPLPEGTPRPELPSPAVLKIVSIIQPAVLTSIAVLVGTFLAPKVGLHAPASEAIAGRRSIWPALKPQIVPGVIAGLASGVALVLTWVIAKPFLPPEFVTRGQEFNALLPAAVRILYGGFTEEILLRWGVMTLLVWLLWRILGRGGGEPHGIFFILSIILAAVIFGIGHLPVASVLGGGLTTSVVIYVVTANAIFGIVAGFLYWLRGLEAAMLAHMSAHLVLITAIGLAF